MKFVNTIQSQKPAKCFGNEARIHLAFTNFLQLARNSVDLHCKTLI